MHPVTVRIESDAEDVPGLDVEGHVPFADSPLAVTPYFVFRLGSLMTWDVTDRWAITHRPTGFALGLDGVPLTWSTREEAAAVLDACDPLFPGWRMTNGTGTDDATIACRVKLRGAVRA